MAEILYDTLFPELLSTAPSVPDPVARRALRNATRELCEQAECYRFDLDNIVIGASEFEITIDVPENTQLVTVIAITLDGQRLDPTSTTKLDDDDPSWRTAIGRPQYYLRSTTSMNEIILVPQPGVAYPTIGLRGVVAVKPARDSTGVEEMFLDQYEDAIIDGALYRLFGMAKMPWSSLQLAGIHQAQFRARIQDAKAYAAGDDQAKRTTVAYGGVGGNRRSTIKYGNRRL